MSGRAVDLAIGVPAALVATPIIVACGLIVFATAGWPPFIRQTRVGADDRPFRVVKLRTMLRDVPVVAKAHLSSDFDQYTPLGRFFRRSSLDELPQLWNVLRGDMSLVGPRPALPSQRDLLDLRRRRGIAAQKPGLTGLAQVLGRESLTLASKVRCEALYRQRQSWRLDLLLLAWTIRAVLFGKGAV